MQQLSEEKHKPFSAIDISRCFLNQRVLIYLSRRAVMGTVCPNILHGDDAASYPGNHRITDTIKLLSQKCWYPSNRKRKK